MLKLRYNSLLIWCLSLFLGCALFKRGFGFFMDDTIISARVDQTVAQEMRNARKHRARNVLMAAPLALAASLVLSAAFAPNYYLGLFYFPQGFMLIAALLLTLMTAGMLTMVYLQNGFKVSPSLLAALGEVAGYSVGLSPSNDRRFDDIEESLLELREQTTSLGAGDHSKLVSDLVSSVKAVAGAEVWEQVTKDTSELAAKYRKIVDIEHEFHEAKCRLFAEVDALGRRGNVNLTLGMLATSTGLAMLSYFVWQTSTVAQDVVVFAISFIPRLSLVVFIELFAFFFLRLYKSGLAEIKYFQNEITNLELKFFALKAAMLAGSPELLKDVVATLVASERNHVLEKGQSTIELEKYRVEQNTAGEVLRLLPKLFNRKV